MDSITPNENTAPSEGGEETLKVYELTPEKTEEQKILEKIQSPETKTASGSNPTQTQDDDKDVKDKKEESILNKIETGLKIKKPAPKQAGEGEKVKASESVWVERVNKVIHLFKRKPFEEQKKAQKLEEDYLNEQHEIKVKDNGEK